MDRKLSLGISPCPNDTYIFGGLLNGNVDTGGMVFEAVFEDVETLNTMALRGGLDIVKVSFHALGYMLDDYALLRSGGALGKGCGPLVVAREKRSMKELVGKKIAVPGEYTTAFLLLKLFDPGLARGAVPMPFHEIMEAVKRGEADAGVIIHEGRFTYPLYDLMELMDLGEWWERETACPIPLGAIAARRSLGKELINSVEEAIRKSIHYAKEHREEVLPFIIEHAQEMDEDVISRHIGLYVNEYSLDLGKEGRAAVEKLFRMAGEKGLFTATRTIFPEG